LGAKYGKGPSEVKSEVIDLEISDAPAFQGQLVADPAAVAIRVGQRTPPIQVLATTPGERKGRPMDAAWSSESDAILAPDPQSPGRFIGQSIGVTQLKATFDKQATTVQVTVTGDAFEEVTTKEQPDLLSGNRFTVTVLIQATNPPEAALEFRVSTKGDPEAVKWKAAPTGAHQKFELVSPPMRQGELDTEYNLMIEARDQQQQIIARYPLSFKLNRIQTQPRVETR
jgi:hypothetical protein